MDFVNGSKRGSQPETAERMGNVGVFPSVQTRPDIAGMVRHEDASRVSGPRDDRVLASAAETLESISNGQLAGRLRVGDVVFIQSSALPFRKVAETTLSWTNHVGVVVEIDGAEPLIAESTFPYSKKTPLSRFSARSVAGRIEVRRLFEAPTPAQQSLIREAAQKRLGIFYDTGFNLHSRRQFCSRFVREVLAEATGRCLGEVERLSVFLARNRNVDLLFWRLWYFGRIPWHRETVTPASLLSSTALRTIFTGYVEQN